MTRRTTWLLLAAVSGAAAYAGTVRATPPGGFQGTTIANATLDELDLIGRAFPPNIWQARLKTKGLSDLYVQSNSWSTWDPGAGEEPTTSGWHTHPGPSLIVVTAGTITAYDGDDPECTPHVYRVDADPTTPLPSIVDAGGGHVHVLRNEDPTTPASTIAVQFVPKGAARRIDADAPDTCPPDVR
jgi:hypothetical protein